MNRICDIRDTIKRRGIAVVIPTFNNCHTIVDVIEGVKEYCDDIIVVNDGSTDGTTEILKNRHDIILISYEKNRGKGYALKLGIRSARERGFSYVISMDADLQHIAGEIPKLVYAGILNPGALVIGKRKNLGKIERTKGSSFANSFSNFWFLFQTWHRITDTQSGMRLYPIKKTWWLGLLTSRYEAELEILVLYAWSGVKLVETPVDVFYPEKNKRNTSFRPVLDFVRISIMNTIVSILAVIIGWPLTILRTLGTLLFSLYAYVAYVVICLLILTPVALFYAFSRKLDETGKDRLRALLNFAGKFVVTQRMIPKVKVSCYNPTNETFEKPAVIICNHQSSFDILMILSLTKKEIILTNDWVWNNPYYGYVIRKADYHPISNGLDVILPKLQELYGRGISTAIFPEGTRSKDQSIGRFHSGAFAIADALGADIIPVVIHGTQRVCPIRARYLRKGKITIEIDRRISHDEYMSIGTFRQMASYFRDYYIKRYEEIRDREDRYV